MLPKFGHFFLPGTFRRINIIGTPFHAHRPYGCIIHPDAAPIVMTDGPADLVGILWAFGVQYTSMNFAKGHNPVLAFLNIIFILIKIYINFPFTAE
jgi:hypothetical protein